MTAFSAVTQYPTGARCWSSRQSGVSDAALKIHEILGKTTLHLVSSATGQARIGDPISALYDLYEQCHTQNWDGEGAEPILFDAVEEAEQLLYLLPSSIPTPEFVPEPTGAIAFEWYQGRDRVYLLSVDGTQSIQFAALMGQGNELHGRTNFVGTLPPMILHHLRLFFRR